MTRRSLTTYTVMSALLATTATSGCARIPTPPPRGKPSYEVYAVRYGTLVQFPTKELVPDADTARRTDAAMMVWLIRQPGQRTVLVDAGFYRDEFVQEYNPADFRRPSDVISSMGVSPDSVTDIIITHVHWDHLDGADLFPNARIWIQRAEYDYYVGPNGEVLHGGISSADALMLADLRAAGRVQMVDGDNQEIIPGIHVYTGGRHTYASQYVAVSTRIGEVVIASDNVYLYENIDRHIPIGTTFDAKANLAAQDRMLTLAAAKRFVIPGHDSAVFQRFPAAGKNVVRID